MMTGRVATFRRRAAGHADNARRYRRNADVLLREGEQESAGELLYGAAKRCINAIANRQGANPVKTQAKIAALRRILRRAGNSRLMDGWQAAARLHIYADQSILDAVQFARDWDNAQTFITAMLDIYDRDNLTTGEQL